MYSPNLKVHTCKIHHWINNFIHHWCTSWQKLSQVWQGQRNQRHQCGKIHNLKMFSYVADVTILWEAVEEMTVILTQFTYVFLSQDDMKINLLKSYHIIKLLKPEHIDSSMIAEVVDKVSSCKCPCNFLISVCPCVHVSKIQIGIHLSHEPWTPVIERRLFEYTCQHIKNDFCKYYQ